MMDEKQKKYDEENQEENAQKPAKKSQGLFQQVLGVSFFA